MKKLFLIIFSILPFCVLSQEAVSSNWLKKIEKYKIQPVAAIQIWSTYTIGGKIFNQNTNKYEAVDNRFNTQIRRSRIGIKGQPYEQLKFNITAALDLVGRDVLAGTVGGANNGNAPIFRAWNAYLHYRGSQDESFNIVAGYFTPQIGRESITSAFRVSSMEKSWSQNYLRRHLVGKGSGRAAGLNLGGLLSRKSNQICYRYDFGIFTPTEGAYDGDSSGKKSAPLFVGRLVANFGQSESKNYSISHKENFFGNRKGFSIAASGSYRGATDLLDKSYTIGSDLLFNYKHLNISGEWIYLWKTGRFPDEDFQLATDRSNTGFVRLSYNFDFKNQYVLTPYFMVMHFTGATTATEQSKALAFDGFSGAEQNFNLGAGLYFNPNFKMTINYTLRNGEYGDIEPGQKVNNLFWQTGVGAIHRGDWLGIGLTSTF